MPSPIGSNPTAQHAPIGVFDSGVGGLSVLHAIRETLPHEHLVYVADSAHAPYGPQSPAAIEARAHAVVAHLVAQGVKAVVVACNTVTGLVITQLRAAFDVPMVAIEPAIKPAAASTHSGIVGVLGTEATVRSQRLADLIRLYAPSKQVLTQACPGWVERVEKGDLISEATKALVAQHVAPLLTQGADTLVLGCTHYPFLQAAIESLPDARGIQIINPAPAVARELARKLSSLGLLNPSATKGLISLQTTGDATQVAKVVHHILRQVCPDVSTAPVIHIEV